MVLSFNPQTRDNYIILTKNNINNLSEGVKILLKTNVSTDNSEYLRTTNSFLPSLSNYSNIIILNYNIFRLSDRTTAVSNCLLTINNIKNNIKFIFTDNKKFGKLVFIKNTNINNYISENNYLLAQSKITSNKLYFHLNYYFNNIDTSSNFHNNSSANNANYDYYKLNIKDYVFRDSSNNFLDTTKADGYDICYNDLMCRIKSITPSNGFTNLYRDSSSSISNFTRFRDISNITSLESIPNTSTTPFRIYNNIYNKYTIYNKKIVYEVDLYYSDNPGIIKTISFETFLIRTNNFEMVKNATSQILFDTSSNIYFLNVQVSTPTKRIRFTTKEDNPYIVYLSLGNFRTGLIQSDIYKHISFPYDSGKINFVENINTSSIYNPLNIKKKYDSLQQYIENQYLYDTELVANILLKRVSAYNIFTSINKIFTIYFNNLFDVNNLKSYYNEFNNIAFTNISGGITRPNISYFNNSANYNINTISFENVTITNPNNLNTKNKTQTTIESSSYNLLKPVLLDVRFNYDSYFNTFFSFDVFNNNKLINTNSISFESLIYTTPSRDFTDVECIYIYHNPETDPNPLYRYPYNNIEIIRDPSNIDTISKAIELLPGASTSTSNSIIIPEKNGSNLSRKMIQGLIGLNNVPKLLSIKPYDENVIVGRGFINQYQIDQECITTTEDIIKNKINANKHSSAKDSLTFTTNKLGKQNFANLVRSNRRNRLSQECIEEIREDIINKTPLPTQVNYSNIVPYTPRFKIFKTGQGHYL
jgi:hypothetical protein|uniref:Uncharacterized protein n=1 Tax=viral metagenome TaxID=1070528 RepID=A0A6C0CBE1_9ZZZZ